MVHRKYADCLRNVQSTCIMHIAINIFIFQGETIVLHYATNSGQNAIITLFRSLRILVDIARVLTTRCGVRSSPLVNADVRRCANGEATCEGNISRAVSPNLPPPPPPDRKREEEDERKPGKERESLQCGALASTRKWRTMPVVRFPYIPDRRS